MTYWLKPEITTSIRLGSAFTRVFGTNCWQLYVHWVNFRRSKTSFQAILWFEALPMLWRYSGQLLARFGFGSDSEILQTLIFVLVGSVISTVIDLPWSVYHTFVIEQRHGFNKQTPGFYVKVTLSPWHILSFIQYIAFYLRIKWRSSW